MFTRLFKENQPIAAALAVIFSVFLWWQGYRAPATVDNNNLMPLAELVQLMINKQHLLSLITGLVFTLINGFLLNGLISRFEIFPVKNYFPLLFYTLYMSGFETQLFPHPILFAHTFILLGLFRIAQSNRMDEALGKYFEAGSLFSLASLFYFPSILLYPTVWVALIVIRPFVWREWLTSMMGMLLPYLFVFTWYFWFDGVNLFVFGKIFYPSQDFVPNPSAWSGFTTSSVIAWSIITALSLWLLLARGWPLNTILSKNMLVVFIWLLLLSTLAFLMAPAYEILYFSLIALPLSVIISNYFVQLKWGFWADCLLLSLISVIVIDALNN
jgi:hypothetical protein